MIFWPFKRVASHCPKKEKFDHLVWETNTLAKVSLIPFVKNFPQYEPILESNLMEEWDRLLTIALTGVAAHVRNILSKPQSRGELKRSLDKWWRGGGDARFDDYMEYASIRTTNTGAPWAAVSAKWVADILRLHSKANEALKKNASRLDFINPLAAFMSMSFGRMDVGLPHYLSTMSLYVEKEKGIDMGLGTKGTKMNSVEKIQVIVWIFESWANKTVELIVEFNADHDKY